MLNHLTCLSQMQDKNKKLHIFLNQCSKIKQRIYLTKVFFEEIFWTFCRRLRFQLANLIAILPLEYSLQTKIAYQLGRVLSPFRKIHPMLVSSFRTALGVDLAEAQIILNKWEASKGLATLDIFRYPKIDKEWIGKYVEIDGSSVLKKIAGAGGVVLTYHTFHQDMLPFIFGSLEIPLIGIAAPVEKIPHYRHVTRYKHLRLNSIEKKLVSSGGFVIYTDQKRDLIKHVKAAFAEGSVVVLACDNNHPNSDFPPLNLLGGSIRTNAGGLLRLAKEAKVPIYLAILYPNFTGGYSVRLKEAEALNDLKQNMQEYYDFLVENLQHSPWAWQGWLWYHNLLD